MPGEEVFYNLAVQRLDQQMAQIDTLDNKANTVLSIGSAILPITAGLLVVNNQDPSYLQQLLVTLSVISYLVLVVLWYEGQRTNRWSFRPDLSTLQANSSTLPLAETQRWVGNECTLSVDLN